MTHTESPVLALSHFFSIVSTNQRDASKHEKNSGRASAAESPGTPGLLVGKSKPIFDWFNFSNFRTKRTGWVWLKYSSFVNEIGARVKPQMDSADQR